MPVTLRPAEDADVSATAAIRTQQSGDKSFWTDRITWYLRGKHSPQQALPESAAFVAVDEGKLVGFVAGHSRVDSVAGVKQRRASADGSAAEALLDRSALGADPSACYLHGGDQACAKQRETGRLRCHLSDLASDLSIGEVGVVNVGVAVSAVQGGDKASFR
jgi:hypothetical protein